MQAAGAEVLVVEPASVAGPPKVNGATATGASSVAALTQVTSAVWIGTTSPGPSRTSMFAPAKPPRVGSKVAPVTRVSVRAGHSAATNWSR